MEHLYSYPLHLQLSIITIVASTLLCVFCAGYGALLRRQSSTLPPIPVYPGSSFPTIWDKLYTWIFLLGYAANSAYGITLSNGVQEMSPFAVIFIALIYMPMVVRLAFLPCPILAPWTWLRSLIYIPAGLVVIGVCAACMELLGWSNWVTDMTNSPLNQNVIDMFTQGGTQTKILLVISACVVAPVGEECLFRGFIYNVLKSKSGAVAAALCSAFFFGAIHGALVQLPLLVVFGLVQCYLYERFRTLGVPILFHAVFNALNLLMVYFHVLPS